MAQVNSVSKVSKVLLAFVIAFSASWVSARSLSDLDAVNQAAFQRTLSMRIIKAYSQMAADVDTDTAEIEFHRSVAEFEHVLAQLELNTPNSRLHQRLNQVKVQWLSFRLLIDEAPDKGQLEKVFGSADDLLYQTDMLVSEWKSRLPGNSGDSLDLATEQSMLSERIGAYYAAQSLGMPKWMAVELEYTITAYDNGMMALSELEDKSQVHPQLIAQLNSNWEYAKMGLSHFQQGHYVPVVIAVTMESMYEQTNTLGASYHVQERLAMNSGMGRHEIAANLSE